jgi:hypothetical protein
MNMISAARRPRPQQQPQGIAEREEREDVFGRLDPDVAARLWPYIALAPSARLGGHCRDPAFVAAQVAIPLLIRGVVDALTAKPGARRSRVLVLFGVAVIANAAAITTATCWPLAGAADHLRSARAMFSHLQSVSQGLWTAATWAGSCRACKGT